MNTHLYQTVVTFAETNVVGNVYFANFFRWLDECRNEWLNQSKPQMYRAVAQGEKRLRVSEASFEYFDPKGVGVAEPLDVEMQLDLLGPDKYRAEAAVRRRSTTDKPGVAAPTAKGSQQFDFVDSCEVSAENDPYTLDSGNAFQIRIPNSLELFRGGGWIDAQQMISWQGKCREQFLVAHAPNTLQFVASRSLALHTSKVSLRIERDLRLTTSDTIEVEMRLSHLRGGRMTMHFTYNLATSDNEGALSRRRRFATGAQSICCKRRIDQGLAPAVFPADLLQALRSYANSPSVKSHIDAALEFHGKAGAFDEAERRKRAKASSANLVG